MQKQNHKPRLAGLFAFSTPENPAKLADKIANLRDLTDFPPADWPAFRRREYFDWAALVIAQVRGVHPQLEALFDEAYARRPEGALQA